MVTPSGFEPENAVVKGQCVKPLHHGAIFKSTFIHPCLIGWFYVLGRTSPPNHIKTKINYLVGFLLTYKSSNRITVSSVTMMGMIPINSA